MNICIPVEADHGMESQLSLQFSSAPKFAVVNTRTLSCEVVDNSDPVVEAGAAPCLELATQKEVGVVVVGGISLDALVALKSAGLSVYSSSRDTVREIVADYRDGELAPITLGIGCKHGGRGFGGRGFGGMGCGGGGSCGCGD
jgi:predicted Fe-Mo cluster-binding NifX family protein